MRLAAPALLLLLGLQTSLAEPVVLESGPQRVSLIELYTSEGCSSCPPADRWLAGLLSTGGLWRDFVPVAFHVDYWDYLGWSDRFADAAFSDRQRRYAAEGGVNTVYTPGMFVNGREWSRWRRGALPDAGAEQAGHFALRIDGRRVEATWSDLSASTGAGTVHVALLGMGLASEVVAGENRGRLLRHEFVVLGNASAALEGDAKRRRATLELPSTQAGADRYAVAAWVTSPDRQAPLQALGGFLPGGQAAATAAAVLR